MSRAGALFVLLCASCGGGGNPPLGPTLPSAELPPPVEPAAERPAAPPPKKITNEPDVPRGAAAARVAELARVAEGVLAAFVNADAHPTPDGKTLLFLSDRDGVMAVYAAPAGDPAAPARRLTDRAERTGSFAPTRDGKAVILRSDTGADESWGLFRVPLAGGAAEALTPDEPLVRGPTFEPQDAPGKLYYAARKKDEPQTAVHELALAGGAAPRVVYTSPVGAVLLDVSRDGKRLALVRVPGPNETYLDLVDVQAGKARQLYPKQGQQVGIAQVHFSADGKRVFVASDGGGEQPLLLALDATTGAVVARRAEPTGAWSTRTRCVLSRRGDRLACPLSVGEHDELRVVDARTLKPAVEVKLPPGTGGPSDFSPDGARLYVDWSSPAAPGDVYAVATTGGAVTPARRDERPGIDALPPLDVSVAEIPGDGVTLRANVYLPPAAKQGKPLPVIVSYHGGPASVAALRWSPFVRFMTALGYAYVEPNVRGSTGFGRAFEMADDGPKRLDAFKDVARSGAWVAAQPWADRNRLVIWGQSYGGYTVLIGLTRMPELWRAGVDLYGPSDLVSFMQSTTGFIRELFRVELGDLDKDRDFLESLSPLRDVAKIQDPLFVYAGANDPRVPRTESDQLVRALRERGVSVEYMVAPDEGHSLSRRENLVAFLARVARFLEDALR